MTLISAVVNTLNEERQIAPCLESLAWVDEVVVVDMHSTDRTVEIAEGYTDRIFFHEPTGYVEPARNFAIGQATGEWVLVVDADEQVPGKLAERLRAIAASHSGEEAVLIPRKNHFCGIWLDDPHSFPDYQCRFFRKGRVVWPKEIHAQPAVSGDTLMLEADPEIALVHLASESISSALLRLDRYTAVEARQLKEQGVVFDWWKMVTEPAGEAIRNFFHWRLYRYGVGGVVGSLISCFHGMMVHAKLWELERYPGSGDGEIQRLSGRRRALWFLLRKRLGRG